jgi:hypothetical protein
MCEPDLIGFVVAQGDDPALSLESHWVLQWGTAYDGHGHTGHKAHIPDSAAHFPSGFDAGYGPGLSNVHVA